MDSKQETKLSMYIAVRDYLAKFLAILNVLPNFSTFYTALQNAITQIQSTGEAQGFDKSGNATGKNQLKDALVTLAVDTARKLTAYAKFAKNQVLLKEMDITESELKRLADTKLKNTAQGIYDRAQTNLASLATYTITAATQTALLTAITNFDKSIGQPRIGTSETSKATKQLVVQFKNGDAALDDIDTVVEIIRLTQVDFYNGYRSVRKLINTGTTTLAIKGMVKDAVTGSGLKGAKISFTLNGDAALAKSANGKSGFSKKSADKGGFLVRTAADGTYTVTVELPGYKKATATVSVISGQMSVLDIGLDKA
jgi:hypothetical protein